GPAQPVATTSAPSAVRATPVSTRGASSAAAAPSVTTSQASLTPRASPPLRTRATTAATRTVIDAASASQGVPPVAGSCGQPSSASSGDPVAAGGLTAPGPASSSRQPSSTCTACSSSGATSTRGGSAKIGRAAGREREEVSAAAAAVRDATE